MLQPKTHTALRTHGPALAALAACLVSLLALALPAHAARNEDQLLAQDRAYKAVAERSRSAASATASPPAHKAVLPLDHGPHATTTPWMNHQRLEHSGATGTTGDSVAATAH